MSMLQAFKTIVCTDNKTKQKVGIEHDLNKLIAKYKKTGQMPRLNYNGSDITDGENVIDLTQIGDFQECQNRIARANEMFHNYPSMVRRRFNNNVSEFTEFMDKLSTDQNVLNEAISLGLVELRKPEKKPENTTVIKKEEEIKK